MKKLIFASLILSIAIAVSCKKSMFKTGLTINLTDAPGPYDSVVVEVAKIQAHYSDNANKAWEDLPTNTGMYDLLLLQNGVTEALVNGGKIPAGKITQLRLILGSTNYLIKGGVRYDLTINNEDKTGIKVQLNEKFKSSADYEITLDFDANKSVVETGSGKFQLKPVIEVKEIKEI